jgi:hypothetical protein
MNPRLLRVCLLAAMPALLSAQEAKLVNCRTLEAAGNFVGPDEVIDGNMVCQKLKPGATAPAKTDPAKAEAAKPQAEAVAPSQQPMSVAEAARANRQRLAAKQNAATAPVAATEQVAPAPAAPASVPVTQPAATVSKPVAPEVAKQPTPAAPPVVVVPSPKTPQPAATAPVKTEAIEPVAPPEPVAVSAPVKQVAPAVTPTPAEPVSAQPVAAAAPAPPAPPLRIKRDAPIAAGTPSEPPEKDYGFSDANAAETPTAASRAAAGSGAKMPPTPHAQVRVGAFDKPTASVAETESQQPNANLQEGQRPDCTKNITLGSMKDEKFAPGAPSWAQTWFAKNQKALPNVCFSAAPMRGAKNYLIVFYMMPGNSSAATPMPDSTAGSFTAKDGSWNYAGDAGATTPQESSQGQVWYATAYSENGAAVAEQWPEQAKRGDNGRVADEVLSGIVGSLSKQ